MTGVAFQPYTPWPFRGRPRPDELFSSWFLRAAHAMTIKPYALGHISWRSTPPPLTRDIDGCADDNVIATMARATVTPLEQARRTLLSAYEGYLFEKHQPLGRTTWILPIGVRARRRHHPGLQFCPACMEARPYFRCLWRVGWATVCVAHRLRLLDRCSQCSSVLSPFQASDPFICHQCRVAFADNERRPASDLSVNFQTQQEKFLADGWAQLGNSAFPYSVQYFQTVRHVARVIAKGPRAAGFRAAITSRWGGDDAPFGHSLLREAEGLEVDDRYRLFDLVARGMHAWPDRFVEAAKAAKLWQSWAVRDDPRPPFAYADLVSSQLARPSYSPSVEEVRSAVAYLRRQNPGFTRRDLIRLLGDSESIAIVFRQERRRRRKLLMAAARRSLT
ncbi:hypothetical protein D3C73_32970 [compost metagenome]